MSDMRTDIALKVIMLHGIGVMLGFVSGAIFNRAGLSRWALAGLVAANFIYWIIRVAQTKQ